MKKSLGAKTIAYPTPVFIVGTYDKAGKPNVMNVGRGGLCCSSPPSVAVSLRKATYTYGNIVDVKADESVFGEDGAIDIEKIRPILYAPEVRAYYGVGRCLGKAFSIGKQIKSS